MNLVALGGPSAARDCRCREGAVRRGGRGRRPAPERGRPARVHRKRPVFFLPRRLRADSALTARALHLVTADVTEPGTELLALRRILQPSNTDSPPVGRPGRQLPRRRRTRRPRLDVPVRVRDARPDPAPPRRPPGAPGEGRRPARDPRPRARPGRARARRPAPAQQLPLPGLTSGRSAWSSPTRPGERGPDRPTGRLAPRPPTNTVGGRGACCPPTSGRTACAHPPPAPPDRPSSPAASPAPATRAVPTGCPAPGGSDAAHSQAAPPPRDEASATQ